MNSWDHRIKLCQWNADSHWYQWWMDSLWHFPWWLDFFPSLGQLQGSEVLATNLSLLSQQFFCLCNQNVTTEDHGDRPVPKPILGNIIVMLQYWPILTNNYNKISQFAIFYNHNSKFSKIFCCLKYQVWEATMTAAIKMALQNNNNCTLLLVTKCWHNYSNGTNIE